MFVASGMMENASAVPWCFAAAGVICVVVTVAGSVVQRRNRRRISDAASVSSEVDTDMLARCRRAFETAEKKFRHDYLAYSLDRSLSRGNFPRSAIERLKAEYGQGYVRPFFAVETADEKGELDFSLLLSVERSWVEKHGETVDRSDAGGQIETLLKNDIAKEIEALLNNCAES